jgi:hypothetical protein
MFQMRTAYPCMKHTAERHFANPETAARKLVEIAASTEPVQDGRFISRR